MSSAYFSKSQWLGYQFQIENLVNSGMSKSEALNRIQKLYQTEMTTSAMRDSARQQANAQYSIADAIRNK